MMILPILIAMATPSCEAAARMSSAAQGTCYGNLAERTDQEMSAQWRRTLAVVRQEDVENRKERRNKPEMATGLLASQRAWLRYRDAQCGMVSDQFTGGNGYGEFDSRCRVELNRQRTSDLQRRAAYGLIPSS